MASLDSLDMSLLQVGTLFIRELQGDALGPIFMKVQLRVLEVKSTISMYFPCRWFARLANLEVQGLRLQLESKGHQEQPYLFILR